MVIIKTWGMPLFFSSLLLVVALLSKQHALQFYNLMVSRLPVDANWIDDSTIIISNYGHVIGFALLAVICRLFTRQHWWQVAVCCLTLAATIEFAQILTPQRQGLFDDFCLSAVGVVLGLACSKVLRLKSSGSLSNTDKNG